MGLLKAIKESIHIPTKIISSISLEKPLQIPDIIVEPITSPFIAAEINYDGIETGVCTKVGTHLKNFNDILTDVKK